MTAFHGIPAPNLDWTIRGLSDQVSITVTSKAAGSYSATTGRYAEGASSTASVVAVVYPSSGKDMQRLAEARRSNETLTVFTTQALHATDAAGAPTDVLSDLPAPWDSSQWEVLNVRAWPGAPAGYEALVQRLGQ